MHRFKVIAVLALVNILFGTGIPLLKYVLRYVDPQSWIFLRTVLATALLLVLQYRNISLKSLKNMRLGWLVSASILGVVVNQLCFAEGLYRTIPAHAAIINATIPIQTLLLGWLFGLEKIDSQKLLGIVIGFAGIFYLLKLDQPSLFNPQFKGDMLVVVNSFSYALFLVIASRAVGSLNPMLAYTWMSMIGLFGVGYYADWHLPMTEIGRMSTSALLFSAYLVVVPTVITYSLNLWALKRVEASQAALFVYFQPIVAALLGYFLLDDIPDQRFYVSSLLVFLGVFMGAINSQKMTRPILKETTS